MPEHNQNTSPIQQEAQFRVLRAIDANPTLSQRELSKQLGISLGKVNYCVKALIDKGWVKATNFKNNKNKISYSYLLTPKGLEQKFKLTLAFLQKKNEEFEALNNELNSMENKKHRN